MESPEALTRRIRTGWSTVLARTAAELSSCSNLFQASPSRSVHFVRRPNGACCCTRSRVLSGLPPWCGIWFGIGTTTADQALSDVLLLGYVGIGALAICLISGLLVTGQALWGIRDLTVAAVHAPDLDPVDVGRYCSPHLIAWWRRRKTESARGAAGWLVAGGVVTVAGVCLVGALTLGILGNEIPKRVSVRLQLCLRQGPSLCAESGAHRHERRI